MPENVDVRVGDRLSVDENICTVQFVGPVDGTKGIKLCIL